MTMQNKNSPIEIIYAAVVATNTMLCYLKIVQKKTKLYFKKLVYFNNHKL